MSGYLTHEDLVGLTGKERASAQVRALQAMGVAHWVRPDGTPAVAWADARPWEKSQVRREEEPDYAALHG